jgi:catechol 2,3-dioxygenase-like lactoylglutathione lyase family enzyme
MIRVGGPTGGTIGLLPMDPANSESSIMTPEQRAGIHIELTTDHLDELFELLKARGVDFFEPPHEEPWERSMRAHDPDGYTVEFAEGRRGHRGVT